jgi:HEPN domain-containing protein
LPANSRKAIKGWLAYHDRPLEKTHDLRLLITLAAEINPAFQRWFDAAEQMTPYATTFRYPGEIFEPNMDEYKRAFEIATQLYDFICSALPPELSDYR